MPASSLEPPPDVLRRWGWFVGLLLGALVVVYWRALHGAFLWDDDLHVTANPTIIGPLGLREIWTTARANYFPLVLTNFWAQHALWGLNPLGYHVVSFGCHLAAAALLWRVLLRLRVPGAWLGAALWALHPVQVESVAWIAELKNTQSAVFFLAAIWFWLRWLEHEPFGQAPGAAAESAGDPASVGRSGHRHYVFALICAVLALLSKPSTVMLPVALALCSWWERRRLSRRDLLALAPYFALSAVAAGWTVWEQKFHSGALGAAWSQTATERCLIAGRVIWFYLGKLAWPDPLLFIYPRWKLDATDPAGYVPLLAAGIVAAVVWRYRDRAGGGRAAFFAGTFFVALLFPVLGFFDVYFFRYSFVGDHFQYLASMGPLALAAAGLTRAWRRQAAPVAGLVLLALGAIAAREAREYANNEALWRATLARNPDAVMAWLNLADTLAKQGRHAESIATFHRALQLAPNDADAHNDLGCEYVLIHRPADALRHLERAVALQPKRPEPHNNLGNALAGVGRADDAIAEYRRALELDPKYGEAENNLGAELAELGRLKEAVAHFEAAMRLNPNHAEAQNNLGDALRKLGQLEPAIAHHREALRLQPDFAPAHASLGQALALSGRMDEALTHLRRAVELKPDFAPAHDYLGRALAATGHPDEAWAEFARAPQLAPNSAEAHNNFGTALAQRGRVNEAIEQFEIAVRLAPAFVPARLNLGRALAAKSRWADAAAQFARAVELKPDAPEAESHLAVALVNQDRLEQAVPHFEAALRLAPTAELENNFAQVLHALGRNEEARAHLEAATRLGREALRRP
jgi:protein O-mannosyl-transferase